MDLRPLLLFTLFVGMVMGACGFCTGQYLDDRYDIEVKVK